MSKIEEFKYIKGYRGLYLISSYGRIISLQKLEAIQLTPKRNGNMKKNCHYHIDLYKAGEKSKFLIHRLVAKHFLKKRKGRNIVDHLDANKCNNRADNLEYVTQKENIQRYYARLRREF